MMKESQTTNRMDNSAAENIILCYRKQKKSPCIRWTLSQMLRLNLSNFLAAVQHEPICLTRHQQTSLLAAEKQGGVNTKL